MKANLLSVWRGETNIPSEDGSLKFEETGNDASVHRPMWMREGTPSLRYMGRCFHACVHVG